MQSCVHILPNPWYGDTCPTLLWEKKTLALFHENNKPPGSSSHPQKQLAELMGLIGDSMVLMWTTKNVPRTE